MNETPYNIPKPVNEPIKNYAPGSQEKFSLKAKITQLKSTQIEIPVIIGGKEIKTGNTGTCVIPHNHKHVLGTFYKAGEKEIQLAIESALDTWKWWSKTSLEERAKIFLK
ncbi:uncharacterized protein METZ01_LOCUS391660, partial [marine metagenome]